ncbi:F420-0--gamma-glutamyl ligase [Helcococcus kunzii]|uniref:coenzyme F420-0:L-glutamate ligase n=1 Tax=Helcococcus kunzii TaxID=40091 RepID=UPI001BB06064|nr:coenzyme F420-0:L-glutamate ligase [Helcococcus kunzii]QUY64464.1 F420-0--gamma-glutamyl ligase [Helcococcus kunzii]
MSRLIGTTAHGIRLPIIKEGDDLVKIVSDCFMEVVKEENINVKNTDIVGITESLLARAQGNYVTLENIVDDLNNKFTADEISLVHPILSRNRFLNILKAISMTGKKIKIYLSYPDDEVGNLLMDRYEIMKKDINVYKDTLTEDDYINLLGKKYLHPFTGLDYTSIYKSVFDENQVEVLYSNNLDDIADNAKSILVANIHDRAFLKELFKSKGIEETYTLADIMSAPIGDSGYNEDYGLYGSNFSSDNSLKLFPREAKKFVNDVQAEILKRSGKKVEVLIYGDGAFKDPIGRIWELADPIVSPGFTDGLIGRPNEVKIKYLADNDFADLSGEEAIKAMKEKIQTKDTDDATDNTKLGTTPRQLTDLVGSLCDLMSGSGDKGTPVIYIRGYFDNYSVD